MSTASPLHLRPAAVESYAALQHALASLADQGGVTPCQQQPAAWVSEDAATRAEAAEACRRGCVLLELCHQYAEAQGERHGCWGGVDRTPRPTTRHDQDQEGDA